ncbi:MAG: glutaredoxin family protein [Burkholderiaceae bacterium]
MSPFSRLAGAAAAGLLLALPAHALYKVVAPDGSVTYTDRPPPADLGKPQPIARDGAPAPEASSAAAAALPLELRQAVARFPVTLYTSTDCAPCDTGRRLLQVRGIPFVEKRVLSEDDAEAMNRLTGGRSVPTLTVGSQALRGLSDADWHAYLDVAGYPRESKLPRGYQPPAAAPLVAREAEPKPQPAPPPPPKVDSASTAPVAPPPAPSGIRF